MTASASDNERHSEAFGTPILLDEMEIAAAEARNALAQYNYAIKLLMAWINAGTAFELNFSHLLNLNRIALEGINLAAGTFRATPMRISNSLHTPPPPSEVPDLVADFCNYIRDNFEQKSALHLAAYALWRINWIHPFVDANGRTARIVSYMILSAKIKCVLPGLNTIPEQISKEKKLYYEALEDADSAFRLGVVQVAALEKLLEKYLACQLLNVHDFAVAESDEEPLPYPEQTPIASMVEYRFSDKTYRPEYELVLREALRTAGHSKQPNWIERNPALVTATSTILAVVLTYWLSK